MHRPVPIEVGLGAPGAVGGPVGDGDVAERPQAGGLPATRAGPGCCPRGPGRPRASRRPGSPWSTRRRAGTGRRGPGGGRSADRPASTWPPRRRRRPPGSQSGRGSPRAGWRWGRRGAPAPTRCRPGCPWAARIPPRLPGPSQAAVACPAVPMPTVGGSPQLSGPRSAGAPNPVPGATHTARTTQAPLAGETAQDTTPPPPGAALGVTQVAARVPGKGVHPACGFKGGPGGRVRVVPGGQGGAVGGGGHREVPEGRPGAGGDGLRRRPPRRRGVPCGLERHPAGGGVLVPEDHRLAPGRRGHGGIEGAAGVD